MRGRLRKRRAQRGGQPPVTPVRYCDQWSSTAIKSEKSAFSERVLFATRTSLDQTKISVVTAISYQNKFPFAHKGIRVAARKEKALKEFQSLSQNNESTDFFTLFFITAVILPLFSPRVVELLLFKSIYSTKSPCIAFIILNFHTAQNGRRTADPRGGFFVFGYTFLKEGTTLRALKPSDIYLCADLDGNKI